MKLLVSDYDDTFKIDHKNLYINIRKVREFMYSGNKFAIATGRAFDSIKNEINKYGIPYNYLICNNGLITFDSKDNIVSSLVLKNEDLKFIFDSFKNRKELIKTQMFDLYGSTDKLENVLEIYAKFLSTQDAATYKACLEYFKEYLYCYQIDNSLFIGNNHSKANAVYNLGYLLGIDDKDIYTIGDGVNDLEMLREFNGYKVINCDKKLILKKIPYMPQVHTLIKKIENK